MSEIGLEKSYLSLVDAIAATVAEGRKFRRCIMKYEFKQER